MDLNGYFNPVSLERPEFRYLDDEDTLAHNISIHTPDQPIRDLDHYEVVLFGIPEDRNAFRTGSNEAPDEIRSKLYQLRKPGRQIKIMDLGNMKIAGTIKNTYFGLRDVILELMEREIIVILLGGSQDLGTGVFQALKKNKGIHHVLTIDPMLDFAVEDARVPSSRNYLNELLLEENLHHFNYTNLGHQSYFVTEKQIDQLDKSYLESIRLGDARKNISNTEPLIRDSEFISIDLSVVRHSDAPGVSLPSPNGFFGDELCQITRYAGLSEKVKILGLFEHNPSADINRQTSHLTAQAIWYFFDGLTHRIKENPLDTPEHTKKFIVNMNAAGHDIIFHKSMLSERWWMEIPVINPVTGYNFFVSCSYEDYQYACNQEIPDRWWRYIHRLGNER